MSTQRFAVRLAQSWLPTAEITVPQAAYGPHSDEHSVVKRRWGFTEEHALRRAYRWTRDHGDPR